MKPLDPADDSPDAAMARRRQRVGAAVVMGLLVAWVAASRVRAPVRAARRVSHDPVDFVLPDAHATLALDLDGLRRAGVWDARRAAGGDCVEALSSRVRGVLVVWPGARPDAFAVVADGDVPRAELERCAADAGPRATSLREVQYRDVTLLQVTRRGGAADAATVLALPGGPALVGPQETLYAMIDAALAAAEGRAMPRALDAQWHALTPAAPLRLAVRWPDADPDAALPQAQWMTAEATLGARPTLDVRVHTASDVDARAAEQRLTLARGRWVTLLPEGSSVRAMLDGAALRVDGSDVRGQLSATMPQLAGAVDEVTQLARAAR